MTGEGGDEMGGGDASLLSLPSVSYNEYTLSAFGFVVSNTVYSTVGLTVGLP